RPGLKVHCLRGADADQDSKDFHVSCPLRHRRVEAVATLFDSRKMKSGGIRDRLKEVGIIQIIIGSGNCRMLPNRQSGDRLREGVTEIGVLGAAAVPSPPTGVQRELRGFVSLSLPLDPVAVLPGRVRKGSRLTV